VTITGASVMVVGHDGQGVTVAKGCCATTNVDNPEIANKTLRTLDCILNKNTKGEGIKSK